MRLFFAIVAACVLIVPPALAQSAPGTSTSAPKTKAKRVEPPSPGQSRMEILGRKSDRLGKQMENSVCKC